MLVGPVPLNGLDESKKRCLPTKSTAYLGCKSHCLPGRNLLSTQTRKGHVEKPGTGNTHASLFLGTRAA